MDESGSEPVESWIWRSGAFAGEFGDAYILNTELEGGHVPPSIRSLSEIVQSLLDNGDRVSMFLPDFSEKDLSGVLEVLGLLKDSADVDDHVSAIFKEKDSFTADKMFATVLTIMISNVEAMEVGDKLVVAGGWMGTDGGHAIMYVVERDADDSFAFVVCNTGEGADYHPSTFEAYPKQKRKTAMRVAGIPAERMLEPAVWYLLCKLRVSSMKENVPAQLYDVVLPFLAGTPTIGPNIKEQMEKNLHGEWETLQRSGTCYYRCVLTTLRYLCRAHLSFPSIKTKQLMTAIRVAFLDRTLEQLESTRTRYEDKIAMDLASSQFTGSIGPMVVIEGMAGWQQSDCQMVDLACTQTARAITKLHSASLASDAALATVHGLCKNVREQTKHLDLLAAGSMEDGFDDTAQEAATSAPLPPLSGFELVFDKTDTEHLAGTDTEAPADMFVDLCLPTAVPTSFTELVALLESTVSQCERLRAKASGSTSSLSMFQICALVEHIVTRVLPFPEPDSDTINVWACECTLEQQRRAIHFLYFLFQYYISSSFSVPGDDASDSTRSLILLTIFAFTDMTLRSAATDTTSPLTTALTNGEGYHPCVSTFAERELADHTEYMVLHEPHLVTVRRRLLTYFNALTAVCGRKFGVWNSFQRWKEEDQVLVLAEKDTTIQFMEDLVEAANLKEVTPSDYFSESDLSETGTQGLYNFTMSRVERYTWWFSAFSPWSSEHMPEVGVYRNMLLQSKMTMETHLREGNDHVFIKGHVWFPRQAAPRIHFRGAAPDNTSAFVSISLSGKGVLLGEQTVRSSPTNPMAWFSAQFGAQALAEEDVMYAEKLRTFNDVITEEDAEKLLSYLTVPYVSIPLLLSFFAGDRLGTLIHRDLRAIVERALFEPKRAPKVEPTINLVPVEESDRKEQLALQCGPLMHELQHAPQATLEPLLAMLQSAVELSVGAHDSLFAFLLQFVVRITIHVLDYCIAVSPSSPHACVEDVRSYLASAVMPTLFRILRQSVEASDITTAVGVYAHIGLVANLLDDLPNVVAASMFVTAWHSKQQESTPEALQEEEEDQERVGASRLDRVPVRALFRLIQQRRTSLVEWAHALPATSRNVLLEYVSSIALSHSHTPVCLSQASFDAAEDVTQWERASAKPRMCVSSFESKHPYTASTDLYETIRFPGAAFVSVSFDLQTSLDYNDWVTIYKDESYSEFWGQKKMSGTGELPGIDGRAPLLIPSDSFCVHFHSDVASKGAWGFRITAFAPVAREALSALSSEMADLNVSVLHCEDALAKSMNDIDKARQYLKDHLKEVSESIEKGEEVKGLYGRSNSSVQVNLQTMEVYVSDRMLMPLPYEVASNPQLLSVFGDSSHYCAVVARQLNRQIFQVIHQGTPYKIDVWTPTDSLVSQADIAEGILNTDPDMDVSMEVSAAHPYTPVKHGEELMYNHTLYECYRKGSCAWFSDLFDSLLKECRSFNLGKGQRRILREEPKVWIHPVAKQLLSRDIDSSTIENEAPFTWLMMYVAAQGDVADVLGHPGQYYEIEVLEAHYTFHIYALRECGRKMYRSLVYSSNHEHVHRYLAPNTQSRKSPPVPRAEHAAGNMFEHLFTPLGELESRPGAGDQRDSLVGSIIIQRQCAKNTSQWHEFVPRDKLRGLIPDALLHSYSFWKESDYKITGTADTAFHGWFAGTSLSIEHSRNGTLVRRVSGSITHTLIPTTAIVPVSTLGQFVSLIKTIDTLSHALLWSHSEAAIGEDAHVSLVEFPRLGLSFTRMGKQWYCNEHAGLFISGRQRGKFIESIPFGVVLENCFSETFLLVPNFDLAKVEIRSCPFAPQVVALRNESWWKAVRSHYYLFPVHISNSFIKMQSLASSLYLAVTWLYRREYLLCAEILSACTPDETLSAEEKWVLSLVEGTEKDAHPDAHSCRLRLALVCFAAGDSPKWNVQKDQSGYLSKIDHVSGLCRLSLSEEMLLLKHVPDPRRSQFLNMCTNPSTNEITMIAEAPRDGGRVIGSVYDVVKRGAMQILSTDPKAIYYHYSTPLTVDLESSLRVLRSFWDDTLIGHKNQTGMWLVYQMLVGRAQVALKEPFSIDLNAPNLYPEELVNAVEPIVAEVPAEEMTEWTCGVCTLINAPDTFECSACETPRQGATQESGCSFCGGEIGDDGFTCTVCGVTREEAEAANMSPSDKLKDVYEVEKEELQHRVIPSKHQRALAQLLFRALFIREVEAKEFEKPPNITAFLIMGPLALLDPDNEQHRDLWLMYPSLPMTSLGEVLEEGAWSPTIQPQCSHFEALLRQAVAHTLSDSSVAQLPLMDALPQGPDPIESIVKRVDMPRTRIDVTDASRASLSFDAPNDTLKEIMAVPLGSSMSVYVEEETVQDGEQNSLPFDLSNTAVAKTIVAQRTLDRMEEDVKASSSHTVMHLSCLSPDRLANIWNDINRLEQQSDDLGKSSMDTASHEVLQEALAELEKLLSTLQKEQVQESETLSEATTQIEERVRAFRGEVAGDAPEAHIYEFHVQSNQRSTAHFDTLSALPVSSSPLEDLRIFNPFVTQEFCDSVIQDVCCILLRTIRLCQINRCISNVMQLTDNICSLIEAQTLARCLAAAHDTGVVPSLQMVRSAVRKQPNINAAAISLNDQCMFLSDAAKKCASSEAYKDVDCNKLVFVLFHALEFDETQVTEVLQKKPDTALQALDIASRQCLWKGRALVHTSSVHTSSSIDQLRSRLHIIQHTADQLARDLTAKRHYLEEQEKGTSLDPRFLVFEFISTFVLRKRQVEMVQEFVEAVKKGSSSVQQMIMGAGKTTVICPLLGLILADGKSLVTQVCPSALLEMSREVLRSTFSRVIKKKVYTFSFDRSQTSGNGYYESMKKLKDTLTRARIERSIVCSTPESVKSLMLKYVELMAEVCDADSLLSLPSSSLKEFTKYATLEARAARLHNKEKTADVLRDIISLWGEPEHGVALIDEVDLVLHPLRSELNFPIGRKQPLHLIPSRFEFAIHLLDALFFREYRRLSSTEIRPSEQHLSVLQSIASAIDDGISTFSIQSVPHVVLLDQQYYHKALRPSFAEWALVWIEAQPIVKETFKNMTTPRLLSASLDGSETYVTEEEFHASLLAFIAQSEIAENTHTLVSQMPSKAIELLTLARDWVQSFLCHCLSKINRISFGILQSEDIKRFARLGTEVQPSRRLTAVPFVGKDCPSASSEFAHPEVLIGLTILAYRYEGMRMFDLRRLVRKLRDNLLFEAGPYTERPSHILFSNWCLSARVMLHDMELSEPLPLELLQPNDKQQMNNVAALLSRFPDVAHYYLCQFVFPDVLRQQKVKLQASGQDIGSDILFGTRIGFSGTPSEIVPRTLRPCRFERGSEAKILRVLTSADVTVEPVDKWTVDSLLSLIAQNDVKYHALIDAGALITGLSNEQVARELLARGLPDIDACVFLDSRDVKMVVDRSERAAVPLNRCGVPLHKRFTFYDQVHTTGMDIKQPINARAMVTLGKDMTLRDYAQGCWRMRGLGHGQTISVLVVREVQELIGRISSSSSVSVADICCWLTKNSLQSEQIQYASLCQQNVMQVWRKRALNALLCSYTPLQSSSDSLPLLRSRFNPEAPEQSVIQQILEERSHELNEKDDDDDNMGSPEAMMAEINATIALFGGVETLPPQLMMMIHQLLNNGQLEAVVKLLRDLKQSVRQQIQAAGEEVPEELDAVAPASPRHSPSRLADSTVVPDGTDSEMFQAIELSLQMQTEADAAARNVTIEITPQWLRECVHVFQEAVDTDIADSITEHKSWSDKLAAQLSAHSQFLKDEAGMQEARAALSEIRELHAEQAEGASFEKHDFDAEMVQEQEQEEEQQKEKQQESAKYERGGQTLRWPLSALNKTEIIGPVFAPLASLSLRNTHVAFPAHLLVTVNHTDIHSAEMRRLRDVHVLMVWSTGIEDEPTRVVIVSLEEAEAIRIALHCSSLASSSASVSLYSINGHWLSAPHPHIDLDALAEAVQSARFFNNELQYVHEDVVAVLRAIAASPPPMRRAFFENTLQHRRRTSLRWEGTSVEQVFAHSDHHHLARLHNLSSLVRDHLQKHFAGLTEIFKHFDTDNDGFLPVASIVASLSKGGEFSEGLDVPSTDLQQLFAFADKNADGYLSYRDFASHFALEYSPISAMPVEEVAVLSRSKKSTLFAVDQSSATAHTQVDKKPSHRQFRGLGSLGLPCLTSGGTVAVLADHVVATRPGFLPSIAPQFVLLTSGKWYYEVTVIEAGSASIGWGDMHYTGDSQKAQGVGDDAHSWGVNGATQCAKHDGRAEACTIQWQAGDVICCAVDVDQRTVHYAKHGQWSYDSSGTLQNVIFAGIAIDGGLVPALSFQFGFKAQVNLGDLPLHHAMPRGFRSVHRWITRAREQIYAQSQRPLLGELHALAGSACVEIDDMSLSVVDQFPTVALGGVLLTSGKWYYEVTVTSSSGKYNVGQIGWADMRYECTGVTDGVGDDRHSWAFDGNRRRLWHEEEGRSDFSWGCAWQSGDVLGCSADLDGRSISYSLNGSFDAPMGVAFQNVAFEAGLRIAASASPGFTCRFNFGQQPFVHPLPEGHMPVWSIVLRERASSHLNDILKFDADNLSSSLSIVPTSQWDTIRIGVKSGFADATIDHTAASVLAHERYPTVVAERVSLTSGVWYYEVTLDHVGDSSRIAMAVGVAARSFFGDSAAHHGVGDTRDSWAFDAHARVGWDAQWQAHPSTPPALGEGATVGVLLDLDNGSVAFYVDTEENLRYAELQKVHAPNGLTPAVSVDAKSRVTINFGDRPFKHAPADAEFHAVHEWLMR